MTMSFYTGDFPHRWEVHQRDGRYAVCKVSNERMRFGADGSVGIGSCGPEPTYWYDTPEFAELSRKWCERWDQVEKELTRQPTMLTFNVAGRLSIGSSFNINQKTVVQLDQFGNIVAFDLPWIVWTWFKTTALVKMAKRLWYGERGQQ